MNTSCPTCQTEYAVTPQDVGRRIACAKCGTHLTVDPAGLRMEEASPAKPRNTTRDSRLTDRLKPYLERADWPTVLFGVGAALVVWFVLMPSVAVARVERRTAILTEATLDHTVQLRKLRERNADAKQISDAEEAWQKQKERLQDEIKYAETARGRTGYYDRYGMILGTLMWMTGAVGWTRAERGMVRRVVGGIVLAGVVLLASQTVLPLGCSPAGRTYNPPAVPTP